MGGLARYARRARVTAEPRERAPILARRRARTLTAVAYTDALGVARVTVPARSARWPATEARRQDGRVGARRRRATSPGSREEALRLALEHARSRRAFGGPLSALEPVQQMLADAATLVDGLTLLSARVPRRGRARPRRRRGRARGGDLHAGDRRARLHDRVPAPARLPPQPLGARLGDAVLLRLGECRGMTGHDLPLAGLRVLDYGQYVAAPFATMLLADLGADVIKVEPPRGDEWRRYDPFEPGESRYFYALNRGKRSVALDLKTPEGRERSRELIATADALVHNCLPERAHEFGLDARERARGEPALRDRVRLGVRKRRPGLGPPAYDLIGQALSGLLLADPRPGDTVPRRTGGLALADFTAGLLAALAVTAGLLGRGERAPELEVSLLGAALALQAQRFVAVEALDARRLAEGADPPPGESASPAAPSSRRARPRGRRPRGARPLLPRPRVRGRLRRARVPQRPASGCAGLRAARARGPVRRQPAGRARGRRRSASGAAAHVARRRGRLRRASACARPWTALARPARARERGAQPRPALRRRAGARERARPDGRAAGVGPGAAARQPLQGRRRRRPRAAAPRPRSDEHAGELLGAPARR